MVAETLDITPQAARRTVLELSVREMMVRGELSGLEDKGRSECPYQYDGAMASSPSSSSLIFAIPLYASPVGTEGDEITFIWWR